MRYPLFGVWNNVVYDNRNGGEPRFGLADAEAFDPGNPIRAFVGDGGFHVFAPDLNLASVFERHMAAVAAQSCGKCTPCRTGAPLLRDALAAAAGGGGGAGLWRSVGRLARQMGETSLCGLGRAAGRALALALDHFPAELETAPPAGARPREHWAGKVSAPCIEACPADVDVPRYVDGVKDGLPEQAMAAILEKYPLAASCGRVCVRACERACRRGAIDQPVAIKHLKRYVADHAPTSSTPAVPAGKGGGARIAVVGAGPAGVTCAYHLLKLGHEVDLFEASSHAGGMASSGIPSYRLPKDVLLADNERVAALGGRFRFGQIMGRDFSIDSLFADGYRAVFLGIGASQGTRLGIEGEDPGLAGYWSGIDFLARVRDHVEAGRPMPMTGRVAVFGGGNVAMDCVRSALRLGASEVHLVYRRDEGDMPADTEEIEAAEAEGVRFHFMATAGRVHAQDGRVTGIDLVATRRTKPDASGRVGVEIVPGSETFFACEHVIAAIGQAVDGAALSPGDGIARDRGGRIVFTPGSQATSRPGVFTAGDCATGPATLIEAMAGGMRAAESIDALIRTGLPAFSSAARIRSFLAANGLMGQERPDRPVAAVERAELPHLAVAARVASFAEVEGGLSEAEARAEAGRCLRCYRLYSFATDKPVAGTLAEPVENAFLQAGQ